MLRWSIGLAVALAMSSATAAQVPPDPEPLPSETPALEVLHQIGPATSNVERLVIFDRALALLLQPTPLRGRILCARAQTLQVMGRDADARRGFEACQQLRPDDPYLLLTLGFDASRDKQPLVAARYLLRAIAISPEAVGRVEPATMSTVFRQLRYARADAMADQLTEALADAGWRRADPATFAGLVLGAMRHRLENGDRAGALRLLPSIVTPGAGVAMLIDRRFAPIWPEVETWAGSDLSAQRSALLAGAQAAYALTHSASDRLALAGALENTGDRAGAIALLQQWLAEREPRPDLYFRNMATVRLGRLLGEAGRRDEGIRVMREALAGPIGADENAMNIVPNLALQLLLAGDNAGALALLDARTPPASAVEAAPAIGYFTALRGCALERLGRHDAANAALIRVQTLYASNDRAVGIAVGCIGSADAQAANWIAALTRDEDRAGALVALARVRYAMTHDLPEPDFDRQLLRRIADRPDVLAAYARYGRALPDRYDPALMDFAVAGTKTPAPHIG